MGKNQDMLEAARYGYYSIVEKILVQRSRRAGPLASLLKSSGANFQDASGYTALHHAALNGHRDVVALLMTHGASVNTADVNGVVPLHLATWSGHVETVRTLLTHGPSLVNIDCTNRDSESPLHFACQYGHTGVVRLLLEHSCDASIVSRHGRTPLQLAALYGHLPVVQLLVRVRPELLEPYSERSVSGSAAKPAANGDGRGGAGGGVLVSESPLHSAARNGHLSVVRFLLESGVDINVCTVHGSALFEAAVLGKTNVAEYLLSAGIDLDLRDQHGHDVVNVLSGVHSPVSARILRMIQERDQLVDVSCEHTAEHSRSGVCDSSATPALPSLPPGSGGGGYYENVLVPQVSLTPSATCSSPSSNVAQRFSDTNTSFLHSESGDGASRKLIGSEDKSRPLIGSSGLLRPPIGERRALSDVVIGQRAQSVDDVIGEQMNAYDTLNSPRLRVNQLAKIVGPVLSRCGDRSSIALPVSAHDHIQYKRELRPLSARNDSKDYLAQMLRSKSYENASVWPPADPSSSSVSSGSSSAARAGTVGASAGRQWRHEQHSRLHRRPRLQEVFSADLNTTASSACVAVAQSVTNSEGGRPAPDHTPHTPVHPPASQFYCPKSQPPPKPPRRGAEMRADSTDAPPGGDCVYELLSDASSGHPDAASSPSDRPHRSLAYENAQQMWRARERLCSTSSHLGGGGVGGGDADAEAGSNKQQQRRQNRSRRDARSHTTICRMNAQQLTETPYVNYTPPAARLRSADTSTADSGQTDKSSTSTAVEELRSGEHVNSPRKKEATITDDSQHVVSTGHLPSTAMQQEQQHVAAEQDHGAVENNEEEQKEHQLAVSPSDDDIRSSTVKYDDSGDICENVGEGGDCAGDAANNTASTSPPFNVLTHAASGRTVQRVDYENYTPPRPRPCVLDDDSGKTAATTAVLSGVRAQRKKPVPPPRSVYMVSPPDHPIFTIQNDDDVIFGGSDLPTPDHPPPPVSEAVRCILDTICPSDPACLDPPEEATIDNVTSHCGDQSESVLLRASRACHVIDPICEVEVEVDAVSDSSSDNIDAVQCGTLAGLYRGSTGHMFNSVTLDSLIRTNMETAANGSRASSACGVVSCDVPPSMAPVALPDECSSSCGSVVDENGDELTSDGSVGRPQFDEQLEWDQVYDIVASYEHDITSADDDNATDTDLTPELTSRENADDVDEVPLVDDVQDGDLGDILPMLESLELAQYHSELTTAGFERQLFLRRLLDEQLLAGPLAITDSSARRRLLRHINCHLPCGADRCRQLVRAGQLDTVAQWLLQLHLPQYRRVFLQAGLTQVRQVQQLAPRRIASLLAQLAPPVKPGHLRRVLYTLDAVPSTADSRTQLLRLDSTLEKLRTDVQQLSGIGRQSVTSELCNGHVTDADQSQPEKASSVVGSANQHRQATEIAPPTTSTLTNETGDSRGDDAACQLKLREPRQLLADNTSDVTTRWRHSCTRLLHSLVNYTAEYLGSARIKVMRGTQSTRRTFDKLRRAANAPAAPPLPQVVLCISHTGVHYACAQTLEVLCRHEVANIHCACQDADDLACFAYVTVDEPTGAHFSHVFRAPTDEAAYEIILTLGQAFEVAYQLSVRSRDSQTTLTSDQPQVMACQQPHLVPD